MKTEGTRTTLPDGRGKRCAIIVARYYDKLAAWLEDGARRAMRECGVAETDIVSYDVPGCFELPLAAQRIAAALPLDAMVALGIVVRGDTPHFEYVAGECARGLMTVQLETTVPIGFGILTTETMAQAEERADPARGDKGYEAAIAALSVATLP